MRDNSRTLWLFLKHFLRLLCASLSPMDSEVSGEKSLGGEELFHKLGLRRFVNSPPQQQLQHRMVTPDSSDSSSHNHTITIALVFLLFSLYMCVTATMHCKLEATVLLLFSPLPV